MLFSLAGRPLAYWAVKNAMALSHHKPIAVVHYQRECLEKALDQYFKDGIAYVFQPELNGTLGAVRAALSLIEKDTTHLLIILGDAPLIKQETLVSLIEKQQCSQALLTILTSKIRNPFGYGRIIRNSSKNINEIIEEKEANSEQKNINEINSGFWIIDIKFLQEKIDFINNNNNKKEFYLTDLVSLCPKVDSVLACEEEILGVNDLLQAQIAQKLLNERLIDFWTKEGVCFLDPKSVTLEEGIRLSPYVKIYPNVHLRGNTHIGEDVVIENGSVIKDSIIERECHILPYSILEDTVASERVKIGPFARLRPKTILGRAVSIGNFVEVKASTVKSNSKINHLSYVGDAEVGEKVNIGAGAITCNFDGHKKHRTIIGNEAFVGSNASLIAPLEIGEKAIIAAGSTINQDVPSNALALGRARMEIKNSYKRKSDH